VVLLLVLVLLQVLRLVLLLVVVVVVLLLVVLSWQLHRPLPRHQLPAGSHQPRRRRQLRGQLP
jgi:hypothetical protein